MTRRAPCGGGLLAVGLAALVAGCGRPAPSVPAPEPLRYLRQSATRTEPGCVGGADRCARITLRWPLVSLAPTVAARESITAFVRAQLFRSFDGGERLSGEEEVMAGFLAAYRDFTTRFPGSALRPWWYERRIEALGDTLGVASFAVTERSDLGGAHPNSVTTFTNVDVASGRTLARADLLAESAHASLDEIGERHFRRVRNLPRDADLAQAGFTFPGGRFRLNDNLAVTRTGLLFFFNDYEIAPHAMGVTQISLPWDEVMPHVRRDGPLARRPGAG